MKKNRIDTADISVVVQGAIDKHNTKLCLNSIRTHIPGAEIILSTWEGSDTDGLDYDILQLSKDPGGVVDKFYKDFTNNTFRQLVSTQKGVNQANRKYILKTRSDLIFKSNSFLNYFDDFNVRDSEYAFFQHRVLFPSFFSKKFCSTADIERENQPLPFHVSDWLAFGLSEDIRYLYDIPLPEEPLNTWYLEVNPYETVKLNILNCSHRYSPEQYIFFHACKKAFPQIEFDHYMAYDRINIEWSEKLIANNCIILNPYQFRFIAGKEGNGIDFYKKWSIFPFLMPKLLTKGLYTHQVFIKDYKKYCLAKGKKQP